MTPETLCCPYCNSSLKLTSPLDAGSRIRCPRCHELIPYHLGEDGIAVRNITQAAGSGSPAPGSQTPVWESGARTADGRRWSNRAVARLVLFVMAVMAVIGLSYAWVTKDSRRERDPQEQSSSSGLLPTQGVEPAKLTALGYLPTDTNVIIGFHVAEWMSDPARQDLLVQLRSDALNLDINNLESSVGLKLGEIDHAVIGMTIEPLSITLVVQTGQPFDRDKVISTVQAKKVNDPRGNLYRCERYRSLLQLWCASDRTLVFHLGDFKGVPVRPEAGVDRFLSVARLLKQMKDGRGPGLYYRLATPVWIVGHASDWQRILAQVRAMARVMQLSLPELPKEDEEALGKVQTFGAWLQVLSDGLQGALRVQCADSAAAEKFEEYLAPNGRPGSGKLLTLLQGLPHSQELQRQVRQELRHSRQDAWVIIQSKADLQSIQQALDGQ